MSIKRRAVVTAAVIAVPLIGYGVFKMGENSRINQPEDLLTHNEVEQVEQFRPTVENPTPVIVENYNDKFLLVTTPEGRASRRQLIMSTVVEIVQKEVNENGGWYTFLNDDQAIDILISQVMRNVRSMMSDDFEIILELNRQYDDRLEDLMPDDLSLLSESELALIKSSIRSLKTEYETFVGSPPSHVDSMWRETGRLINNHSIDLDESYPLDDLNWFNIEESVRIDYLSDLFNDMPNITDYERTEFNGVENSEDLLELVTRMADERIESYESFNFMPYKIEFLQKHNLDIDVGANRNDLNDMFSWMMWVYRQPLRERALEGVDQNSAEWESINSNYINYQPEAGWRTRLTTIKESEEDITSRIISAYESWEADKKQYVLRIRSYESSILRASHSHRRFVASSGNKIGISLLIGNSYGIYRLLNGDLSPVSSTRDKMSNYYLEVENEWRQR